MIYTIAFCVTGLSAVVSAWYLITAAAISTSCNLYDSILNNSTLYTEFTSQFNMGNSTDPLYFCATNPTSTFLNSSTMTAGYAVLTNLTTVQTNFNNSIPASILTSKAINHTDTLLAYLKDLSTMPINGSSSIADILISLNKIGDYTYPNSTQAVTCNISRDEFVFDPIKCTRMIVDPSNATDVKTYDPRCIQLPTNNRTSGTVNTSLNMMQHLYTITAGECSSIPNIFDPAKNCFLKQRATQLFNSTNTSCLSVYNSYTSQLKSLVAFSWLAGEYTDAFVQNVRNYLGNYLTVSSNMTAFFVNNNVSAVTDAIGNTARNITSMTNCSYPS